MSDFPHRHDNAENDVVSPFPSLVESRIQRTPAPDDLEKLEVEDGESVAAQPDESAAAEPAPTGDSTAKSWWRRIPRPKRKSRQVSAPQDPKSQLTPVPRRLALPAAPAVDDQDESADPGAETGTAEPESEAPTQDLGGGGTDGAAVAEGADAPQTPPEAVHAHSDLDDAGDPETAAVATETPNVVAPQDERDQPPDPAAEDDVDTVDEGPAASQDDDMREQDVDPTAEDEGDQLPAVRVEMPQDEDAAETSPPVTEEVKAAKASQQNWAERPADTDVDLEDVDGQSDDTNPTAGALIAESVEESDRGDEHPAPQAAGTQTTQGDSGATVDLGDVPAPAGAEQHSSADSAATSADPFESSNSDSAPSPRPSWTEDGAGDRSSESDGGADSRELATVGAEGAPTGPATKPTSFRGPGLPMPLTAGRPTRRFTAPHVPISWKRRAKSGSWQPSTPPRPLQPMESAPHTRQLPRQLWPIVTLLAIPAVVVLIVVLLLV